jgi:glycyl-tRNA synthetase beta chain
MAEMRDCLFELGTEELPPKSLLILSRALQTNVEAGLGKAGLFYGRISAYATPRRLALHVKDLAAAQPDQTIERRGPALNAAYAADGTPSKALEGFMKSCGATLDQLMTLKTDKGEWVGFMQEIQGGRTVDLLPDLLRRALAELPIAKRMRWGNGSAEFVRPVQWIVLLFGDEVITGSLLDVPTGRLTYGHRFHHPEALELRHPEEYAEKLSKEGFVRAHFEERKHLIRELAQQTAATVGGIAHIEADLLDEVAALVEWPVPVLGGFDARYLVLPPEVLMTTMQENQKYFPVQNAHGGLLPYFITFSNLASRNLDTVRKGNERVVRPRLSDAEFFWNQDRKRTLESRVPELAQITFQKTLGSVLDKTHRVQQLAVAIATRLGVQSAWVERAAWLAKADLLTLMVNEFPELQGVMGRYYALAEGEPEEIATAILEQYLPKVSGGDLPKTPSGRILALAEKLDTLTGIFSVGLIPTGDKDPYALRRAALGAIRIILESEMNLDLPDLLDFALGQLHHDFDKAAMRENVYDFILERLRGILLEDHFRHDEFEAVLSLRPTHLLDFERRIQAVREFRQQPAAASLSAANKRIRNILRKAEEEMVANVDDQILVEFQEKNLLEVARQAKEEILPLLHERNYTAALLRLSELRDPVDAFFDQVMVMVEDAGLRRNRLGLLGIVEGLFLNIADISKLQ